MPVTGQPNYTFDDEQAYASDTSSGLLGRWNRYMALRERADENSMSWWRLKIFEAAWIFVFLAILGAGLGVLSQVTALGFLLYAGIGLVILGGLFFLRAVFAPLTCKWVVFVPDNAYYVVEDNRKRTIDFIVGGQKTIVPWSYNAKVLPYVDFNFIPVYRVRVENVMNVRRMPVDIEVSSPMRFDPTLAHREALPMLRKMTQSSDFEGMLTNFIRDTVAEHLTQTGAESRLHVAEIRDVPALKTVLLQRLKALESMGLFNIDLVINVTMQQRSAQILNRLDRMNISEDIHDIADELGITPREALQLYSLIQRPAAYRPRSFTFGQPIGDAARPEPAAPASSPPPPAPEEPAPFYGQQWVNEDTLAREGWANAAPGPETSGGPGSPDQTRETSPKQGQEPPPDPMRDVRRLMQNQGYVPDPMAIRHDARRARKIR